MHLEKLADEDSSAVPRKNALGAIMAKIKIFISLA